jgi:hypothetical protein
MKKENNILKTYMQLQNSSLDENGDHGNTAESDSEDCSREEIRQINDDSTENFIPTREELTEEKILEVGMHFDTLEAAHMFLNVYGYFHGFGVIKGWNYKNKKYTLQCNKCRTTHNPGNAQQKRKRSVMKKTKCPMNVIVKL